MKLNNYSLYYRTYPKWDVQCQDLYSTQDFVAEGKKAAAGQSSSKSIFITSIILYCIVFFNIVTPLRIGKHTECIFGIFTVLCLLLEFGLMIALIIMYANTLSNFGSINIDMFRYAVDYSCSDGPL
jgi:hypothetical protein